MTRQIDSTTTHTANDTTNALELCRSNFASAQAEAIIADLWINAHRTLTVWIGTGEIFAKIAAIGRPVTRSTPLDSNVELVKDLVDETIIGALGVFKRDVIRRRWRAERGASLRSYFVGACILEFPNSYRRARTRAAHTAETLAEPAALNDELDRRRARSHSPTKGIPTLLSECDELARWLAEQSPMLRNILTYIAEGYTAREAADLLGTTDRAVWAQLARLRARLRLAAEPDPETPGRHRAAIRSIHHASIPVLARATPTLASPNRRKAAHRR